MAAKQSAQRKSVKGAPRSSKAKSPKAASSGRTRKKDAKQPKKHRWLRVAIGLLVAAVLVVVAAFSWNRWLRFDDAADFQGNWQASGQAAVVVIDGKQMHLTDEVAYDYTLDTWAKTIDFSFGKLSGSGTYRFSDDRRTRTIIEGGNSDLLRDFLRMFGLDIGAENESDLPATTFAKAADDAATLGSETGEPAGENPDGDASSDGDSAGADAGGPSDGGGTDGEGADGGESAPEDGSDAGSSGGADDAASGDGSGSGGGAILFDEINDRGVSS